MLSSKDKPTYKKSLSSKSDQSWYGTVNTQQTTFLMHFFDQLDLCKYSSTIMVTANSSESAKGHNNVSLSRTLVQEYIELLLASLWNDFNHCVTVYCPKWREIDNWIAAQRKNLSDAKDYLRLCAVNVETMPLLTLLGSSLVLHGTETRLARSQYTWNPVCMAIQNG